MGSDSFIDGLRPRSAKTNEFISGHKSIEFGSKTITKKTHKELAKIERPIVKKSVSKPAPKKSYARDVLGLKDEELEFDSEDIKKERRKRKIEKRQNRKKKNKKKFIFRHKIFSFIVAPILILGVIAYLWGDSIMLRITNGQSGLFDFLRTVVSGNATLKVGADGRTNILIFGTSGYDMAGNEAGGVHDGAQLTDSIMVLSIDQNTKDVAMVSLPRDLKTDTCTNTNKLNELYYCENKKGDNEIGGANALKNRVANLLNIEIQYYAHINWMSLIQIVDAIGGINVIIDEDISDDWTKTYIKSGVPVNLNGEQALGLARARHGTTDGDFTRGRSQQKIMIAIKDKVASMHLGITDLINLANILGENLRSDFNSDTIYAGAKVFAETDFDSIREIPIIGKDTNFFTTGIINGISYVYPTAGVNNYKNIQNYIKQSFLKNPVILENAQIAILNGSGVKGLEEKEREALQNSIFNVKSVGAAPSGQYLNKLYLYEINNKPATKEKLETYYDVKVLSKDALPSNINTSGIDFVIILGVGYSAD